MQKSQITEQPLWNSLCYEYCIFGNLCIHKSQDCIFEHKICLQNVSKKAKDTKLLQLCEHLRSTTYCKTNLFASSIVDMYLGDYYQHQGQWCLAEKLYLKSASFPFENENDIDDTSPLWPYNTDTVKIIQRQKYIQCGIHLLIFSENFQGMQYFQKMNNLFPSLQTISIYNRTMSIDLYDYQYERALRDYRDVKFFNYDRNQYLPKETQKSHGATLQVPLLRRDEFLCRNGDNVYDKDKLNTYHAILDVNSVHDQYPMFCVYLPVSDDNFNPPNYMDPLNGILCLKLTQMRESLADKKYFIDDILFNLLKLSVYDYDVQNVIKYYENDIFCYEYVLDCCNKSEKQCKKSHCDDFKLSKLIENRARLSYAFDLTRYLQKCELTSARLNDTIEHYNGLCRIHRINSHFEYILGRKLGTTDDVEKLLIPLNNKHKQIVRCFCEKSHTFNNMISRYYQRNAFTNVTHIKNMLLKVVCKNINICIVGNDNLHDSFSCEFETGYISYQDIQLFGIYNFGNIHSVAIGITGVISLFAINQTVLGCDTTKVGGKYELTRDCIRTIRVSLLLFSNYIIANVNKHCKKGQTRITQDLVNFWNNNINSHNANTKEQLQNYSIFLSKLSMLSLGIQSYMFLDYKKYINFNTKSKYNFKHLSNYLKKFVIHNIENNLYLPFKTFKYNPYLQMYAYLYLFQSYFLIGNRTKMATLFPKIKGIGKKVNTYDIRVLAPMMPYMKKSHKMMPARHRMRLILSYIANTQRQHYETPNTADCCEPSILRSINLILNKDTRHDSLYCKWKNILNDKMSIKCYYCQKYIINDKKIKQCSRCKKAYYCDKKCQKKDWKFNNHSEKCKQK